MKYLITFMVFVCSVIAGFHAFGNTPPVANAYEHEILIGQQVQVDLSILAPKEGYVIWPELDEAVAEHIELVSNLPIDTILVDTLGQKGVQLLKQSLFLTSWDSGLWVVPPFQFQIGEEKLETEAIMLSVQTLELTEKAELKDIKDIYLFPVTWLEILIKILKVIPYVWGGIILLAILAFLIGRSPKKKAAVNVVKQLPHEKALGLLTELKSSRLWEEDGQLKAYHVAMSEIVRDYLQHRFVIPALESTTDEIDLLMKKVSEIPEDVKLNLIQALRINDMAKFAKVKPSEQDNVYCLETAFELVNKTLPSPDLDEKEGDVKPVVES